MTDKKKLKEIKKLADAMYYAAFNLTTDASLLRKAMKEYHQFIIHEYCKEEPVAPKVLEDMLNAKTAAESLGISQEEHDRIVDELIYGKEPELVDVDDLPNKEEEPVSDECIYNRTLEERQRSCKFCSAACQVRIKEEPVSDDTMTIRKEWFEQCKKSWYNEGYIDGKHNRDGQFGEPVSEELENVVEEIVDPTVLNVYGVKELARRLRRTMIEPVCEDLKEAAKEYVKSHMVGYNNASVDAAIDMFIFGAKWQKAKDQETIELAEDHAMLAGMEKMKEQMMAKAIEGTLLEGHLIRQEGITHPLHSGKKVKLVVIKEE